MRLRIVSGGQTGVDRAALDVALELQWPCGGWCPRGRKAEDGVISARYPLQQTSSSKYVQRTRWNVRDSDGTLIIAVGPLTGGTAYTQRCTEHQSKPLFVVDLARSRAIMPVVRWIESERIRTLNVAGPRESSQSGIGRRAATFLRRLCARLAD